MTLLKKLVWVFVSWYMIAFTIYSVAVMCSLDKIMHMME